MVNPEETHNLESYSDELKMEMAWMLMDSKKYEEAMLLLKSMSGERLEEMRCNGMARALTGMGFYREASRLLRAGLKRFPESYGLWIALGGLHGSLGDDLESLKCVETALRFAPEDRSAGLYDKACVLIKLGRHGDALPIIDELIEKYPDDPKHYVKRGDLALDMGYPRDAIRYFQKAMNLWKRSPDIDDGLCLYTGLCSAYLELGMKKEAVEIALEGVKRFPEEAPSLYQNAGAAFIEMGWKKECIEILKKGREQFPDDEDLKNFLNDMEDDPDDPDGSGKPPWLGVLLIIALICKRMGKK